MFDLLWRELQDVLLGQQEIKRALALVLREEDLILMDQATLDALAQHISDQVDQENSALDTLKSSLAFLEQEVAAQGTPLDFTNVNNAVAKLDAALADEQNVAGGAPQPPPPPQ